MWWRHLWGFLRPRPALEAHPVDAPLRASTWRTSTKKQSSRLPWGGYTTLGYKSI